MTDLEALIKRAERQQQQLKLEVQFQKNMALFKENAKAIYDEFFDYTPKELVIAYDAEDNVNLVNVETGTPVYNCDPVDFCRNQVDNYELMPSWMKVGFRPPPNNYFMQNQVINRLIERYNERFQDLTASTKKPINVMVITGCGLGYHIAELLERMEIYTLCIFEPHKDSFYACLHTLDWEPILNYINQPGRLLKLFIDNNYENTMTSLRLLTNKIGLHNISNTYLFQHLSSKPASDFVSQLRKHFHLTLTGTGFLEDEQISIAHTVENLNRNTPVLNDYPKLDNLPPLFLVGNGPSLDGLMETLRDNQHKAIVVSCGSTIGTLFKAGIVPDFHIEMERTDETTEVLKELADADYKKKIPILALNTVPPDTLAFFERAGMAIKVNDPGEYLINTMFARNKPSLNVSNPTCTNTGIAYAMEIGFREVYLFGVDLGMKDERKHHASSSQYFDGSSKVLDNSPQSKAGVKIKGNFSEWVYTTPILDTSRVNMELSLKWSPWAKAYNLNDGAYIQGAEPLNKEDLNLPQEAVDKTAVVERIFDKKFDAPNMPDKITEATFKSENLNEFFSFIKNLKFSKEPRDLFEIQDELNSILRDIQELKDTAPVAFYLLGGSTQNFFSLIFRACLTANDRNELIENYRYTTREFTDFLNKCSKLIDDHCLRLHSISQTY